MTQATRVAIPTLVRIKPDALARVGVYLSRLEHRRVAVFLSDGLIEPLAAGLRTSLEAGGIEAVAWRSVASHAFEDTVGHFVQMPRSATAVVGFGGGKALDVAKYVAFLARLPYFAVPTSLSNDGFCSPQSSLTVAGQAPLPARSRMPFGVVVDTEVCLPRPRPLALRRRRPGLQAHRRRTTGSWPSTPSASRSTTSPRCCPTPRCSSSWPGPCSRPGGVRLLGTSLMLNGIAMEICGSSRPASGSEHLISHALDAIGRPPAPARPAGGRGHLPDEPAAAAEFGGHRRLFEQTGFWDAVAGDKFSAAEWLEAVRMAPTIKPNFYTVLSTRDVIPEVTEALANDLWLKACFTA